MDALILIIVANVPMQALCAVILGLLLGQMLRAPLLPWATLPALLLIRLDRQKRGVGALLWRGVVLTLILGALAVVMGWAAAYLPGWLQMLLGIMLLAHTIWQGSARHRAALMVAAGVAAKSGTALAEGLTQLQAPAGLTQSSACRHALKRVTLGLMRDIYAPCLWFLLAGLPGLLLQRLAVALITQPARDERVAGAEIRRAPTGLYEALMLVPALLAVLALWLCSLFVPGQGGNRDIWPLIRHQAARQGVWTDGAIIAAMACLLGVAMAGQRKPDGSAHWIGEGSAKVAPGHLRRGVALCGLASLVLVLLCLGRGLM